MPFIVDDIAVAAVTAEAASAATGSALAVEATGSAVAVEAATAAIGATAIEATATAELTAAAESTVASEVTTALDVVSEGSTLTDIQNLEGDLICQGTDRTIDLSDATFVDEFPHGESAETTTNIGSIDENVFYDEFPSNDFSDPKTTDGSENLTETADNNCSETDVDSPRSIKTINDSLVGQNHPETGVPYVEKEVVTDTGEKVKGVFPQFESKVDVQLPEDMEQAPDRTQFAECNKQLAEKVANDPELRAQFTEDQLADIEDGYTPDGYTWHHNEEKGKMQLVDTDIHSQTRHTGGRNIWGGGTENRH